MIIHGQGGEHISKTSERAVAAAQEHKTQVEFVFNDVRMVVFPEDAVSDVMERWNRLHEEARAAYEASPEGKARAAEREAERAKEAAREAAGGIHDEAQMRESSPPKIETPEALIAYIQSLVNGKHTYGTCVYAMSLAAVAAFDYVARQLGATGRQASCADLDVLRRTRQLKCPFMLLTADKALYPQYDLQTELREAMEGWKPWLKKEARKKLEERGLIHPAVEEHWKKLAKV